MNDKPKTISNFSTKFFVIVIVICLLWFNLISVQFYFAFCPPLKMKIKIIWQNFPSLKIIKNMFHGKSCRCCSCCCCCCCCKSLRNVRNCFIDSWKTKPTRSSYNNTVVVVVVAGKLINLFFDGKTWQK